MSKLRLSLTPDDARRLSGLLAVLVDEVDSGRLLDLLEHATGERDSEWLRRVLVAVREGRVAAELTAKDALADINEATLLHSLADAVKALRRAREASLTAADRRAALPAGSSRAKVTSANARWATLAEDRDRCAVRLGELVDEAKRRGLIP